MACKTDRVRGADVADVERMERIDFLQPPPCVPKGGVGDIVLFLNSFTIHIALLSLLRHPRLNLEFT